MVNYVRQMDISDMYGLLGLLLFFLNGIVFSCHVFIREWRFSFLRKNNMHFL